MDGVERTRRSDVVTKNYDYPTFPECGPTTHFGRIGRALTDIDARIGGVTEGGMYDDAIVPDKLVADEPEEKAAFRERLDVDASGVDNISGSGKTGRNVLKAADAETARTVLDVDASGVDHISGSGNVGREVLKANDAETARTVLGVDASGVDHISGSGNVGRNVLKATSQAQARNAIGAGTSSFSGAYADLTGAPEDISDRAAVKALTKLASDADLATVVSTVNAVIDALKA